ncbi:hypothetical protein ABFX02_10G128300 [Erythranthe guttata]
MKCTLSLWVIVVILLSSRFCFPTMASGIISKTSYEIPSNSSSSMIKSRKIIVHTISGGSRSGSTSSSGIREKLSSIRSYFVISFSVFFVLFFV